MRSIPISLGFFLATAIVAGLQMIPIVGILFIFMLAMFWSVVLINAGMLGVALEALFGRVSRWWLIMPVTFYSVYAGVAAMDRHTLSNLNKEFDASNAKVNIAFDPYKEALVFEDGSDGGSWFVQNYNLPVSYSKNGNYAEGFRSNRLMSRDICSEVGQNQTFRAAGIYTFGFFDGDAIDSRKMEAGFCDLGMPERPTLPMVTVASKEDKVLHLSLPINRVTKTIITPNGKQYKLLGGVAAPLSWIPMPIIGCGLNSGAASWECDAGFWRHSFTPIVSGNTLYSRDSVSLARALGLKRVEIADRTSGDATLVRAKMAEVEESTLQRQLAALNKMIADPAAKVENWDMGVISSRPEVLSVKADMIMVGLERAVANSGSNFWKTRESGRILARLVSGLPHDQFVSYRERLLAMYRAGDRISAGKEQRDEFHWLWEAEPLLRRLGDLGPQALFIAVDPRASVPNVNGAGIETMCRIGAPGQVQSGPVLLEMWRKLDRNDSRTRATLFVALRRIGVKPPQFEESEDERERRENANSAFGGILKKHASPMEELEKEWGDVAPSSLPRVCSPNEWQARREEQRGGKRRTNLN